MIRTVFTFCILLFSLSTLYGDGGFLPPKDYSGKDLTEPGQRAIVIHAGNREKLFLYVDYHGDAKKFVWIIPCPSMPKVRKTSPDVFKEVAKYYHHLEIIAWKKSMEKHKDKGLAGMGASSPKEEGVKVHKIQVLGPYEIATISALKEAGLLKWLEKNGYSIPKRIAPILKQYIEEKWFFVAIKINTNPGELQSLPPIALDFETKEPIYPLRISSISSGLTDIRLYYFLEAGKIIKRKEYELMSPYAIEKDFPTLCPVLAKEEPDIDWQKMELLRIADKLPPQVMSKLDDRIHKYHFYPYPSLAKTLGIAEAFVSKNKEEAKWTINRMSYYSFLSGNRYNREKLPKDHLTALHILGKRLGNPLRDKLIEYLEAYGIQKKPRYYYKSWGRHINYSSTDIEGATILLIRACDRHDPKILAILTKGTETDSGGTFWGNALHDLNTPGSRRALARIALAKSDLGAAFRFVYSLEDNEITEQEKWIAIKELLAVLSNKELAGGDVTTIGTKILKKYTKQDFGEDWEKWQAWYKKNAVVPKAD